MGSVHDEGDRVMNADNPGEPPRATFNPVAWSDIVQQVVFMHFVLALRS